MRKKKFFSLNLASSIILQLTSGIDIIIEAETCDSVLNQDLTLNSQTQLEMQEVKENAEELLMTQYTGFDNQVKGAAALLKKLWLAAPSSTTLSVNNGKSHTRNGVTYPGSIVTDTFSAYALYKYCPWVFDTSITGSFTGGQYLFLNIYEGWWSTWS